MEDEDEDVVFEGSAIHQHLLDVGFTDFEQSAYLPPPSHGKSQEDSASAIQKESGWLERQQQWCQAFPHHFLGSVASLLQQYICASVARTVVSSKLVSEDDWLVLEHFLPDGEVLQNFTKTSFTWHTATAYRDVAVVGVCLVLAWMVTENWLLHVCVLLGAITAYIFYGIYLVWRSRILKQFVTTLKEMVYLSSKTVRLVQEVDLIAKGFVLAQGPGASLATPYDVPPQILSLMEAVLSTVTAAAKILLAAYTLLEPRAPHHPTIRHLFDESAPLEDCCTFSERKQYLKDQVTVIKLQTSAVLTKLLLWLYNSEGLSDYKYVSDTIFTHVQQATFIDKLHLLKRQYNYNKSFWLTDRPSVSESQCLEEKKKNVYLAIHSLALHLQAALLRVQSLETEFERESDTAKLCNPDSLPAFPAYEHVKEQLTALRVELDSCQGCIEEAEARAERKYGIAESCVKDYEVKNTTEDEEVENTDVKKPLPVLLYDQEIPPPEDEVFEAYIDQESVCEDGSKWDDELWSADARKERQVLRQQKAQGKRVLKELQPILTNRRRMWEEREKVALEKHGRKAEKSLPFNQAYTTENKTESSNRKDNTDNNTSPGLESAASCESAATATVAHSSMLTCRSVMEEEEDSDEERLRAYRKVRKELDEDEEERLATEGRLGGKTLNFDLALRGLPSLIDNSKESTNYIDSDSDCDEEKIKIIKFPVLPDLKQFPIARQGYDSFDKSNNIHTESDVDKSPVTTHTQLQVFSTGEKEDKDTSSDRVTKQEDETFSHNEDIDDNESQKIDWTTFRFPTQQTDTLDDRLHLFSGGSCLGFQAEVAAKASAASRNFWMAAKHQETFGGVGEGQVFGSDSDSEKESDSDVEET